VYSQLLQLFSRGQFAQAVKQHQAERNAKGFSSWEQFVVMLVLPGGVFELIPRSMLETGQLRIAAEASWHQYNAKEADPGVC
jgi:hypothetical protein